MLKGCAAVQTGWNNRPAGTLKENSIRTNGKFCTEEERTTCKNTGWSLTG